MAVRIGASADSTFFAVMDYVEAIPNLHRMVNGFSDDLQAWADGWEAFWAKGGGARTDWGSVIATYRNPDGSVVPRSCAQIQKECEQFMDNSGRTLTTSEWMALGELCRVRNSTCALVRIHETHKGGTSIPLGHNIFLMTGGRTEAGVQFLLAHEVFHVVQFEDWGPANYFLTAIYTQFIYRALHRDAYGPTYEAGKAFVDYGMEQQAQIFAMCVARRNPVWCTVSPYGR